MVDASFFWRSLSSIEAASVEKTCRAKPISAVRASAIVGGDPKIRRCWPSKRLARYNPSAASDPENYAAHNRDHP